MRRPALPVKRGSGAPHLGDAGEASRVHLPGLQAEVDRLRQVISRKGIKKDGPYPLSAGGVSPYLFDLKPVMLDPEGCDLIGRLGIRAVHDLGADFVGGREIGAVPLAALIARASFEEGPLLRGFFVRKKPKEHGLKQAVEGNLPTGGKVVVVEDVTTTGASVLETIRALEPFNAQVMGVLTVVDRQQGAGENLRKAGYEFRAFLFKSDFPELADFE